MSTDRELLELAARAVGYDTDHSWNASRLEMDPPVIAMVVHDAAGELVSTGWNPLDNDGDALRLAVRLKLEIEQNQVSESEESWCCVSGYGLSVMEEFRSEPSRFEATRRAIVRAAAEIGRSMP
jgi:hypothetical protein